MDDPRAVDGRERGGHADRGTGQGRRRQRAVLHDHAVQTPSLDVLGDQVRRVRVRVRVKHRGGAEGRYPPRRCHLVAEPLPEVRLDGELRADHLDRDRPAEGVTPEIDGAHTAAAQAKVQHVPADGRRITHVQRLQRLRRRPTPGTTWQRHVCRRRTDTRLLIAPSSPIRGRTSRSTPQ